MSSSSNPRESTAFPHWEKIQTFEDLVAYVGPAPVGQLAGAEPLAEVRGQVNGSRCRGGHVA